MNVYQSFVTVFEAALLTVLEKMKATLLTITAPDIPNNADNTSRWDRKTTIEHSYLYNPSRETYIFARL